MPKSKAKGKPVKKPSASKMGKKTKPTKAGIKKATGETRKIRFKPGTVALREIRRYQMSTKHLIPVAPFARLIKKMVHDHNGSLRMTR